MKRFYSTFPITAALLTLMTALLFSPDLSTKKSIDTLRVLKLTWSSAKIKTIEPYCNGPEFQNQTSLVNRLKSDVYSIPIKLKELFFPEFKIESHTAELYGKILEIGTTTLASFKKVSANSENAPQCFPKLDIGFSPDTASPISPNLITPLSTAEILVLDSIFFSLSNHNSVGDELDSDLEISYLRPVKIFNNVTHI